MCGVIHSNNFCYLWRFFHFLIHTPFLTKARGLDPSLRLSQLPDCYCRWVTAEALGRHWEVNLSLPPFQHRPPTTRLRDHDTCSDNNWHPWSEKEGQMAKGMIDDIAAIEKRERCGARVRSNTSIWRMEPDQGRSEMKDKEGQKYTKPKQAKGSTEKSFSFHLHSSKLVKLHRGLSDIFSSWRVISLWRAQKELNSFVHMKNLLYLWFVQPHCKRHGLVTKFSKWKIKPRHASESRRKPGNSVSSISALRPIAQTGLCRPQAQMNKYFHRFLFVLLFWFSLLPHLLHPDCFFSFSLCIQTKRIFWSVCISAFSS